MGIKLLNASRYNVAPFVVKGTFTVQEESLLGMPIVGQIGMYRHFADAQEEADLLTKKHLKHLEGLLDLTKSTLDVITDPDAIRQLTDEKYGIIDAINWCNHKVTCGYCDGDGYVECAPCYCCNGSGGIEEDSEEDSE